MSKIVVLSTVHHYLDSRIYKEITSLKKKYSDITYIVPSYKNKVFVENGITITPLPLPKSKFERIKLQRIVWRKIKNIHPDVVHFHDPELIIFGYLLKKKLKIKIIFDVHENILASIKDKIWIPSFIRGIIAKLYSVIELIIISSFDGLIIAEKSYKCIYGSKAIEILNFPLLKTNKLVPHKNENEINFVYVGNITELRGIYFILNIFKSISISKENVKLHLVGRFSPSSLEEVVVKYLEDNKLTAKVTIYGQKHIIEVYKILENMDIGFAMLKPIGNYIESLPTKIFDYMINGVVVVASDFDIYNEYIIQPNTGITVKYDDVKSSVEKILELCKDKYTLREMSSRGVEFTNLKWNWLSQEKKLLQLYSAIIK